MRYRSLAAAYLLLVVLLLPASAWAKTTCFGETVPGELARHLLFSAILILSLQLVFYVAAHLAWMVNKKVWPPADSSHTAYGSYLVATMATLTSVVLGVWGAFLGPAYRPMLFGEGSSSAWNELPLAVQLLFGAGHYSWLIPGAMIALWHATKHSSNRARYFAIALAVEVGVLYSILWAIYEYMVVLACPM